MAALDEPTASILAITGTAGLPPHPWINTIKMNINAKVKIFLNMKVSFENNKDNRID
jgi:ribosomal protein L1